MKKARGSIRTTTGLIATAFLIGTLLAHTAATAADDPLTAAGPFDVAARYYLPEPEIMSGE